MKFILFFVFFLLAFTFWANSVFAATLTQISSDPYTNSSSQHKTEVEPDTFSFGTTVVSAFQVGRFFDGGATNIGFATSTDSAKTWTKGFLPGITKFQGGTFNRVSDPAVAYDKKHNIWLISSLPLTEPSITGSVVVSRSTDGGLTWQNPIIITQAGNSDKNWTVCDNTPSSPYYGHCYTQWDDHGQGNLVLLSTSTDGGITWSKPVSPLGNPTGLGGQPLVQPNGTVIVPIDNAFETALLAFTSQNGGTSWNAPVVITNIRSHRVAAGLRTSPLPSAEIDASGKVYVVWQDCRFIISCKANDIVMTNSQNGKTWSPVVKIPIDPSGVADHFIPGLAVDNASSASARLGVTYYYYPNPSCRSSTCLLNVGFVSSKDSGATWSTKTQLAGPMNLLNLPPTTQGFMVGDYISTSFVGQNAAPVFAIANPKTGIIFDEAMYSVPNGISLISTVFTQKAMSEKIQEANPNQLLIPQESTMPLTQR